MRCLCIYRGVRSGGGGKGEELSCESWLSAGGDNRKIARSAQRRVGPKARPMAGAPAPGSPVRASVP
jgi:hypothetical protein